jgi:hypothetical protein
MTRQKERIEDEADERMSGSEAFRWWQRQQQEDDIPPVLTAELESLSPPKK